MAMDHRHIFSIWTGSLNPSSTKLWAAWTLQAYISSYVLPKLYLLSLHSSFQYIIHFNGFLWKANHHTIRFWFQLYQKDKLKQNVTYCNIYKRVCKRSNSDHTSPFEVFWSPKCIPLRRWKHMDSIFSSTSIIPLLKKVTCFLLVCLYFIAIWVIFCVCLRTSTLTK